MNGNRLHASPSVLWIHQNFVTARQPGISRPVHIVSALYARGCTVHIVAPRIGYLGGMPYAADEEAGSTKGGGRLHLHRIAVHRDGPTLLRRPSGYLRFAAASFLRCIGPGRVDVVYCSTPPLPQVAVSVLLSIVKRSSFVLELRDLWPAYLRDCGYVRSKVLLFFLDWLESLAYNYAEACIVVVPPFHEYLARMGVPEDRISVIPTGSDPIYAAVGEAPGSDWRRKNGFQDDFLILYTGSFNETYRFDEILEVADRLQWTHPRITWLFAGNGRQMPLIMAAASRNPHIRYLGNVPKDDLLPVYLAADVGIVTQARQPLRVTALSGKLFDYVAAKLFVICLAEGVASELLRFSGGGIVIEAPSVQSIERAVRGAYEMDPRRSASSGTGARDWMLSHINAVDMGDAAARVAMETPRAPSRAALLGRALRATARGFIDAVTRRSEPILRDFRARDASEWSKNLWQCWLEARERAVRGSTTPPREVPDILSQIPRT